MNSTSHQTFAEMPHKLINPPVIDPQYAIKTNLLNSAILGDNNEIHGSFVFEDKCVDSTLPRNKPQFSDCLPSNLCLLNPTTGMSTTCNGYNPDPTCVIMIGYLQSLVPERPLHTDHRHVAFIQQHGLWEHKIVDKQLDLQRSFDHGYGSSSHECNHNHHIDPNHLFLQPNPFSMTDAMAQDQSLQDFLLLQSQGLYKEEVSMSSPTVGNFDCWSPGTNQSYSPEFDSPITTQGHFNVGKSVYYQEFSEIKTEESTISDETEIDSTGAILFAAEGISLPSFETTTYDREMPYMIRSYDPIIDSDFDETPVTKRKRVRSHTKNASYKKENLRLNCKFLDCKVICSSEPSLARHIETHKWRGQYTPIRCEGCKRPLSNEFSVQRHILKSRPTSLCHRMRVYSIMKSKSEVELTVRFYPNRPHGKKTEEISLESAITKYSLM